MIKSAFTVKRRLTYLPPAHIVWFVPLFEYAANAFFLCVFFKSTKNKWYLFCGNYNACANKWIDICIQRLEKKQVCVCAEKEMLFWLLWCCWSFPCLFSRFIVSIFDALTSVVLLLLLTLFRAFDKWGVVAGAFFPVKGHAHAARTAEDTRVGAFYVSRAVSWVRLQWFAFALAAELESLMAGAIGGFLSFQVECSWDGLTGWSRAPAPPSSALQGLVGAVSFASGDEGGFGLLRHGHLFVAGPFRSNRECRDNGFSWEVLAVSVHALLPWVFDFGTI